MFTFRTKLNILRAIITKKLPFYIQFYVSHRCHLDCKMCHIVESNRNLMPFPSDKIEDIASNLIAIGASVVLLTGGEPFLRDDIIEIVKIFKTKGLDVRMQTAGLLKRFDIIKKCSQYGVNDINVSIDSLDENLSDYLNGRSGSWRQAIQTIGRICREFPKKSSVCAFGCVLSPYNIDHIESVLDLATELGWWLSLVPAHTNPPEKNLFFRGMDHYFIFQEEDYPKVAALINRLKKRKRQGDHLFDSIEYLDSIRHFIEHGTPSWRKNNLCDTPHLYFAIKPDGRFAPCCDHDFIEDIYVYDKEFPKIFKSKSFQDKVTTIAQNCPGCNFGSYPEMTLTVRSFSTLLERVRLQFRSSRIQHRTIEDDQLFNLIDSIKQKYPVYSRDNTMPRRQEKYSIPKH